MTITEYAKRDAVRKTTALKHANDLGVGRWHKGRREVTEEEWQRVKGSIRPKAGRPPKAKGATP